MYEDLFNKDNVPESNWFKFEKVGDRVSGIVVGLDEKEAVGEFPAQRVFQLKQPDESILNVGISMNKDYIIQRTNSVQLGDMIGFEFQKEIPAKTKGYAPAKSIEVYVKKMSTGAEA